MPSKPPFRHTRTPNALHIDTSLAASGSRSAQGAKPATRRDRGPPSPPFAAAATSRAARREPSPTRLESTTKTSTTSATIPPSSRHPDESFLESQTPVDAEMADQYVSPKHAPRDSHDLSLPSRDVTRDSLVANMLLSLDQMPVTASKVPQYDEDDDSPQFFDIPRARIDNPPASAPPWNPGGHQYSYSSDFEGAGDESSRFSSSQYSRGDRSNSSATVQDAGARLHSAREAIQSARPDTTSRGSHARGRVGSKSSSIGSAEGAHAHAIAASVQRRGRGFSRSASFDSSPHPHPQLQQQTPSSPFQSQFSNSFLADDFDAAPTPTIPSGPRREPPSIPPSRAGPVESPVLERQRSSSRSIKSSSGRNKTMTSREAAPPMPAPPAFALEAAPAPNVGYGKSKDSVPGQASPKSSPAPAAPPKKRPGFFERVFGGGSSKNTTPEPSRPSRGSATDKSVNDTPTKMQPSPSPAKVASAPPSRDTTSSHSNHPVLQKKTSSFFRRRKKSVLDEAPPLPAQTDVPPIPSMPPIKLYSDKEKPVAAAEPSPVSSLRQVMNPYLRDGPSSPATPVAKPAANLALPIDDITNVASAPATSYPTESFKREFSPDYEPSPNAVIRRVHSDLDKPQAEPTVAVSTPKSTEKKVKRDNSFLDLEGGSDNDEDPSRLRKAVSADDADEPMGKDDTIRAKSKTSPKRPTIDLEESASQSNLALPLEGARAESASSVYATPVGTPSLRVDTSVADTPSPKATGTLKSLADKPLDEPDFVVGDPTEDERQKAQKIFDGNEEFIQKEKAAAWMGEEGPIRQRTLQAYMELYDFKEQSVVHSLRQICGRLVFRAETQQVDRILVAFSKRWCKCNENHGFKSSDVIHTICYSIMLLNTDLHMADIEQKMTRSQFVKNTMGTITQAVEESVPNAFGRPSILAEKGSALSVEGLSASAAAEPERKSFRNSFLPPARTDSVNKGSLNLMDECGPLVKAPFTGGRKGWEEQVELVLKGIYGSIRDERLPLFGADPAKAIPSAPSQNSLSVKGMLKRTPSMLSKAPSESQLSLRGRVPDSVRGTNSRWTSKSRSRPGMGRNGFNSSRTSFDDDHSIWSPASSSAAWSRQSLGRTQTSASQDSFGSSMPRGDYQQSIGFANALSQAIIRHEEAIGFDHAPSIMSADFSSTQLLEDESLELAGPPWVKEGMVIHKHHLDGVDKKAKDRNWSEVFAVIQKGQMSLFSFTSNKSMRQKSRSRATLAPKAPVGGGNWQDNATSLGTFNLRQTLASALPPPGYSRTRPHVWALSLPTGAVHLFQVGTSDIIKEFVTTANYWSARLSTHPLVGGISNIEYGWSSAIVNNALVSAINETTAPSASAGRPTRPGSSAAVHGRKSSASSFRSASIDHAAAAFTHVSGRGKLPGDRINIAEWAPPTQSLRPSNFAEAEQLETLTAYVKSIEDELQQHNQLRSPMLLAFTPRGHNAAKAMANWERKSAYLLREIVKFRTYVDCLQQADTRKQEIYAERDLAQRAARGELTDGDMDLSGDEGDETLRP